MRHFQLEAYGPVSPGWRRGIELGAEVSYVLVATLGLIGLFHARRNPLAAWTLFLLLFHAGMVVAAFGLTRFRLPLMPFLMLMAAPVLVQAAGALRRLSPGPGPGRHKRPRAR